MKYCRKCLQPDTRPNTNFKSELCPSCNFSIQRSKEFQKDSFYDLDISNFKNYIKPHLKEVNGYNCCLGVSGGKDSTRQAIFARDVLGLNPILVSLIFPPELITIIGSNNLSNLSNLGFQIEIFSPAPLDWKRLMLLALKRFGNPLVPTEQALYASVPKFAISTGLKLILWGENPALQLGDLNTLGSHPFDGDNLRKTNTLKNTNLSWFKELDPKIESISPYQYPSEEEYCKSKLKTVFMGPVMHDWSLINNSVFACLNGIEIRDEEPEDIGDNYGVTALDQNITLINQVIKYLKFGFGRMTDFINEEIRLGRISRQEGIKIVEKYDGKCADKYFKNFANYLDISYEELWEIISKFVNYELFTKKDIDKFEPKFKVGEGLK